MNPSIAKRNLLGGLLGGLLGILLAWYVNPLTLPFGVFGGVLVGWWHTEIARGFKSIHAQAKDTAGGFVQVADEALIKFGQSLGMPKWLSKVPGWFIKNLIAIPTKAISHAPFRLHCWHKEHPMNLGYSIFVLAAGVCMVVCGIAIAWLFGAPPAAILGLLYGELVAGAYLYRYSYDGLREMRRFYREWEVLSRFGPLGLLGYFFLMFARYVIGVALFIAIGCGWGAVTFCIGFFAMYPIMAFAYSLHLGYSLVKRAGHWLCFGVTLFTTTASWLVFRHTFNYEAVVWVVALLTGITSGALTEAARKVFGPLLSGSKLEGWVMQDPQEYMWGEEEDTGYLGVLTFQIAGFWFRQSTMARILRTICFDTPVARPIS